MAMCCSSAMYSFFGIWSRWRVGYVKVGVLLGKYDGEKRSEGFGKEYARE